MSRITDLMTIEYIAQIHCTDSTCQKCTARQRWLRRKAWRNDKSSARKNYERN